MNAPCHDIGGHQGVGPALGEGVQCTLALALGAITVHRDGTHSLRLELTDDPVRTPLGAAEYERLSVLRDDLGRDGHPLGPIDLPEMMDDISLFLLGRFDVDPHRIR